MLAGNASEAFRSDHKQVAVRVLDQITNRHRAVTFERAKGEGPTTMHSITEREHILQRIGGERGIHDGRRDVGVLRQTRGFPLGEAHAGVVGSNARGLFDGSLTAALYKVDVLGGKFDLKDFVFSDHIGLLFCCYSTFA